MKKYKNDKGQVAILYSPGYGAGWSTWNSNKECIFDPDIVELVLKMNELKKFGSSKCEWQESPEILAVTAQIEALAKQKWGENFCSLGAMLLSIVWLNEGQSFRITDHAGYEKVNLEYKDWLIV